MIPSDELDPEHPRLRKLSRAAADELVLLSCLAPVICTNLATPFSQHVYATDASMAKGGIVAAKVEEPLSALVWRSADRNGQNVPMKRASQVMLPFMTLILSRSLSARLRKEEQLVRSQPACPGHLCSVFSSWKFAEGLAL